MESEKTVSARTAPCSARLRALLIQVLAAPQSTEQLVMSGHARGLIALHRCGARALRSENRCTGGCRHCVCCRGRLGTLGTGPDRDPAGRSRAGIRTSRHPGSGSGSDATSCSSVMRRPSAMRQSTSTDGCVDRVRSVRGTSPRDGRRRQGPPMSCRRRCASYPRAHGATATRRGRRRFPEGAWVPRVTARARAGRRRERCAALCPAASSSSANSTGLGFGFSRSQDGPCI